MWDVTDISTVMTFIDERLRAHPTTLNQALGEVWDLTNQMCVDVRKLAENNDLAAIPNLVTKFERRFFAELVVGFRDQPEFTVLIREMATI